MDIIMVLRAAYIKKSYKQSEIRMCVVYLDHSTSAAYPFIGQNAGISVNFK